MGVLLNNEKLRATRFIRYNLSLTNKQLATERKATSCQCHYSLYLYTIRHALCDLTWANEEDSVF